MADDNDNGMDEASDAKSSVGDIFGVSSGTKKKKKKKKKKKAPEPEAAKASADEASEADLGDGDSIPFPDEDEEDEAVEAASTEEADDEPVAAAPKKKKKKKQSTGLEGVLLPGDEPDVDLDDDDDYLGPADLGDYEAPKSKAVPTLIGIIVLLVVALGGTVIYFAGLGDDLVALFKGELREKRIAEARMEEEQFHQEQLDKVVHYGNLMIQGTPQYALVKLNGQPQYGKTSAGWREVRVGTSAGIQDLKIKEPHQLEFSAPGFEPMTVEVTEGKWQQNPGAGYAYSVSPSLVPKSIQAKQEYDARLSQDTENEYFGSITINTMPSGATVTFDNKPLLNEEGEELKTPVTFEKYWVKDEESGELEEKEVRVDTALDVGHKIELAMEYPNSCAPPEGEPWPSPAELPECGKTDQCCPAGCSVSDDSDCKWPAYVTSLTRPMWTCTWNTDDGQPPTDIPQGKSIQESCDYSYSLDLDFNGLKNYIIARAKERERIKKQYEKMKGPDAGNAEAETAQAP